MYENIFCWNCLSIKAHCDFKRSKLNITFTSNATSIFLYDHTWDDLARICWGRHLILQPREEHRTCTLTIIYVLFREKKTVKL